MNVNLERTVNLFYIYILREYVLNQPIYKIKHKKIVPNYIIYN